MFFLYIDGRKMMAAVVVSEAPVVSWQKRKDYDGCVVVWSSELNVNMVKYSLKGKKETGDGETLESFSYTG